MGSSGAHEFAEQAEQVIARERLEVRARVEESLGVQLARHGGPRHQLADQRAQLLVLHRAQHLVGVPVPWGAAVLEVASALRASEGARALDTCA